MKTRTVTCTEQGRVAGQRPDHQTCACVGSAQVGRSCVCMSGSRGHMVLVAVQCPPFQAAQWGRNESHKVVKHFDFSACPQ